MNTTAIPLEEEVRTLINNECRALQFFSRTLVDQRISGAYKSLQKGSGIEFEEARLYSAGDDARRIDWKISARKQQPYIKSFREEKDSALILLTDVSRSTHTGRAASKFRRIVEVAAFLASMAMHNQDAIGCIPFSTDFRSFIPPKKGMAAVWRTLQAILQEAHRTKLEPGNSSTTIIPCLRSTERLLKRKCNIFILSDFNFEIDFEMSLNALASYHNVYAIRIQDSIEKNIPKEGMFAVTHPETGLSSLIDFSSIDIRLQLQSHLDSHTTKLTNTFATCRVPLLELDETDIVRTNLFKFFQQRRARRG